MEPNHLTVSQTNWNKHGLFGKLVLWNMARGVRSQKTQVNLWLAVCLNQINKSNHIFSIGSYCIESIVLNRNRIALHRNRGELYCIASCFICIFNVSYRWQYIEMRIASASVMGMHIPSVCVCVWTGQKFGIIKMFLNEVSYAHLDCII